MQENPMSDSIWMPNDGIDGDFGGSPSSSSSRSIPIYVLFLIMLGSGILTLVLLWICTHCIHHKRRVRRARRTRADMERNAAARQRPREAEAEDPAGGTLAPALAKDLEANLTRCDAGEVELTYVVVAGEEQPTFLARPLQTTTSEKEPPPSISSPTKLESDESNVSAMPDKTSFS